ncbi:MAG: arylsulfatase [Planctomycetes bacterium]|nr:arylsulfatase [Planctomycetota bacterium]
MTSEKPNVIVIMADDMGYSDIGCFGSEIETPNLDQLGNGGLRFSQMYNCARCCPSRASLLTGLYPHQAGVGHMVNDTGTKAYQGYLRDDCMTVAEVMKENGYRTLMSGKWHVGSSYPPHIPAKWHELAGDATHPLPVQRGFDEHYGTLCGAGSFYDPPSLIHNCEIIEKTPDDYYYTDAINDNACRMINEAVDAEDPFYMYVAHTAPHWPLHAPEKDIEKYKGKYSEGWDVLREQRYAALKEKGLIDASWDCSPRDKNSFPWEDAEYKEWEDTRMATYAAMIDVLDQGIGRIMQTLKERDQFDNTLIVFLSDNGGCAEFLQEDGKEGNWPEFYGNVSSDGVQCKVGNNPQRQPGGKDTFMSYDLPWANASNTPFRLFKSWVHEGGISTPCLMHWPKGIKNPGSIHHQPWVMLDIVATCYDICDAQYPQEHAGHKLPPIEGESFAAIFSENEAERQEPIFWEHKGNKAVRDGKWKLVKQHNEDWELFDMQADRTELHNLVDQETERVEKMIAMWDAWAARCEVRSWPLTMAAV